MVRKVSIEAYYDHLNSGKALPQWAAILKYIRQNPGCTRRQIKEATGIEISSVTGRVASLVSAGLVFEGKTIRCPKTRKAVTTLYRASERDVNQVDMFQTCISDQYRSSVAP